jgi:hypothetical protein
MLTLEDMVGSTHEARTLQYQQYVAHDAMYDARNEALAKFNHNDSEAARKDEAYVARKADYESTVVSLEALLGPDAHCNAVDTDLWSLFSDCYKDDVGMRPRFHQTRAQVQAYLARP